MRGPQPYCLCEPRNAFLFAPPLPGPTAKASMDLSYSAAQEADLEDNICLLRRHLLSHTTATAALAAWCERRGIGSGPIQTSVLQRAVSSRGARDVGYRRVKLLRGDAVLSFAEIRYRCDVLNPAMTRTLEQTKSPFGEVVAPLDPRRVTTFARFCADPLAEIVLFHHATVLDRCGRPIARVRESYQGVLVA